MALPLAPLLPSALPLGKFTLPGIDCWKMSGFIAFNPTYRLLSLEVKCALSINVT